MFDIVLVPENVWPFTVLEVNSNDLLLSTAMDLAKEMASALISASATTSPSTQALPAI